MEEPKTPEQIERSFLHDICNGLAVVQGSMQLIVLKGKKSPPAITLEDIIQRLDKALVAVDKVNKLVAQRRDDLIKKMGDSI